MPIFERLDSLGQDKYHKRSVIVCIVIAVVVFATIATAIGIYASGIRKPSLDDEIEDKTPVESANTSTSVNISQSISNEEIDDKTPVESANTSTSVNISQSNSNLNRPNILFIILDDLRPTLGCYGDQISLTPNIDQLAKFGYTFRNAYAQQALCAPSRTSFLTSRRPDTLQLYDTSHYWRTTVGNFTTLPQHLKENGYYTFSIGKVFHNGIVSNKSDDYPYSWSDHPYHPSTMKYKMKKVCPSADGQLGMNLVCPVTVSEQPEGTLPDLQNLERATAFIKDYANRTKDMESVAPFFLGVGFYKPHIPLKFPRQYLDLYPLDKIPLAPNRFKPPNLPDVAWNPWTDLRERDDVSQMNISFPYGPIPDTFQKLIRQAYYASVSYVDDLIGELLEALIEAGFSNNTAVILLGDHGWSLGEHQEWSKYSNFDVATNVPLIIVPPTEVAPPYQPHSLLNNDTIPAPPQQYNYIDQLVELVDLFPTVSELVGVNIPPLCPEHSSESTFCTEGRSLMPLLHNTSTMGWKSAIFSQYPRPFFQPQNNSDQPAIQDIKIMGYTMRTTVHRYTEWVQFDHEQFKPNWDNVSATELYLQQSDQREDDNVANKPEFTDLVQRLSKQLRDGWRKV